MTPSKRQQQRKVYPSIPISCISSADTMSVKNHSLLIILSTISVIAPINKVGIKE